MHIKQYNILFNILNIYIVCILCRCQVRTPFLLAILEHNFSSIKSKYNSFCGQHNRFSTCFIISQKQENRKIIVKILDQLVLLLVITMRMYSKLIKLKTKKRADKHNSHTNTIKNFKSIKT